MQETTQVAINLNALSCLRYLFCLAVYTNGKFNKTALAARRRQI